MDGRAIIFFDGHCNLCDGAVRFVLDRDGRQHFAFASLQSDFAREFFAEQGLDLTGVDSVVLYDGECFHFYSDAVLRIGRELGGAWSVGARLGELLPRPLRNRLYRLLGSRRYAWFGRRAACRLPRAEERARFLG